MRMPTRLAVILPLRAIFWRSVNATLKLQRYAGDTDFGFVARVDVVEDHGLTAPATDAVPHRLHQAGFVSLNPWEADDGVSFLDVGRNFQRSLLAHWWSSPSGGSTRVERSILPPCSPSAASGGCRVRQSQASRSC